MEKHIEINCKEFNEYTLEQRKKLLKLQMQQYIKMLSIVFKHLNENMFQIDFIINEDVEKELEIEFKANTSNIEEEFFKNFEELIGNYNINTNRISFIIHKGF